MKCEQCHDQKANYRLNIQTNFGRESLKLCKVCYEKSIHEVLPNLSFSNSFDEGFDFHSSFAKTKPLKTSKKKSLLEKFGKNLNYLAKEGKIDPVIGRNDEIEQLVETLNRRNKNNPVLIGEPGVGKTAIAEGLALRIIEGNVSVKLADKEIYLLDVASIVAGTSVRGQFEDRMKKIVEELESRNNVIAFIDEIHLLVGAGSAEGTIDAGNILKPSLARGNLQLVGATTLKEYRNIEKDSALERRFQPILVNEPSVNQAIDILKGLRSKYEEYHQVSYSDEVIESCVRLAERYIPDRQLPDKAIDLLDSVGAKVNLRQTTHSNDSESLQREIDTWCKLKEEATVNEFYEMAASYRIKELDAQKKLEHTTPNPLHTDISLGDLHEVVERKTGIPVSKLQSEEQTKLQHLQENISAKVIGQQEAVSKVTKAIKRSRAGLKGKNRPVASFLFVGPTGVGKTELAKVLAEELFGERDAMVRLDMSEFMEKHSVSKLIGSPPGYVGFNEAGQLTEKIRRKPYSILLLDEIEKAHPDVQHMFLQILEDGHLTDSQGRKVSFKDTVIIATSNAGNTNKVKSTLGFNNQTEKETSIIHSLKDDFKPEFLNRFDNIVPFHALEQAELVRIVDLLLVDIKSSLEEQHIHLEVTDEAKVRIAEIGYDPTFGARPLRRAIQEQIEDNITDFLLDDHSISHILVTVKEKQIRLDKRSIVRQA